MGLAVARTANVTRGVFASWLLLTITINGAGLPGAGPTHLDPASVTTTGSPPATAPAVAAANPPFSPNVKLSSDSMKVNAETSVASDTRGNLYAGWISSNDTGIGCGFSGSQDDGKTWSAPEYSRIWAGAAGDPVVAADELGNLYRVCILGFGNWWNDVSRSTDGGRTWSTWTRFSGGDHEWLIARGGKLHYFAGSNPQNSGSLYMRSADDGKTWTKGVEVSKVWVGRMALDSRGNLYVVAQDNNDFWFSKSVDGGATWQSKLLFTMPSLVGPEIEVAPDGDHVYIVNQGRDWKIEFRHSGDGGATWDSPVDAVAPGNGAERPSIARDCAGTLHLAWVAGKDVMSQDAYYSSSKDHGNTWSPTVRISDESQTGGYGMKLHYTKLTLTPQGDVVYVWDEGRNGKQSVFYSSAPLAATCGGMVRIEVAPAQATVQVGKTVKFSATGYDASNQPMPMTPAWTATGGAIDQTGFFTPSKVGGFTVTAADGGVTGTAKVTVTPGALARIVVDPPSATITADETAKFTARGEDAAGNPLPVSPQWSSSGGAVDGSGLFAPVRTGTFTVTASDSGVSGASTVTVTPGRLVSLEVRPGIAKITADDTLAFEAVGRDGKGNEAQVSASWGVSGGSGAGTIDAGGKYVPDEVGEWTVVARAAGVSAESRVTVTPGRPASLSVSPESVELSVGGTARFSATGTDSKGNRIPDLDVAWSVAGKVGRIDATGEFTATAAGSGQVLATATGAAGEVAAAARVTVNPGWEWRLPFLLAVVAAIAVSTGALWARRRRKRREKEAWRSWQGSQGWRHWQS